MSIKDGGSAFPGASADTAHGVVLGNPGMTLRDYFAAAALQGLVGQESFETYKSLAIEAYKTADAMLAVREFK